ncbi:carboxy terminal-processing peptidase [Opitutales bacterium]|nr:carboxy terminal-processing peptidase [Opitutales bacterium]
MKSQTVMTSLKTIKQFSLFLFLSVTGGNLVVQGQDLYPTALMKHETQWLIKVLEQAHFNKLGVPDLNATSFIERFVNKLDKQKLYFTKREINEFHEKYAKTLKTHFEQGNLLPGFEIYNKYKHKAISRLNWVLNELDSEPDLFGDKSYEVNVDTKLWSESEDSLDKNWKNLISFEFIRDIINQVDDNTTTISSDMVELEDYIIKTRENLKRSYTRWINNINEFESSDVQEIYLTTFTHMFDPHTVFMNMKQKERFDQEMNNEFVGIGARLQDEDGYCTIKSLLPGGPAEASRDLEPEDVILKVAQSEGDFVDVVDMKLTKIVDLIKGPKDTLVRLEIKPIKEPGSTKVVRIIRDKIKLTENLAKASLKEIDLMGEKAKIGIIELPSFYGSSGSGPKATDDVEELIKKLKLHNIKALVLDLRRNGGGYLSEAVSLTGLFITRGPVVQVKNTDGKIRKKFDFNPKLTWNGPLFTLVSRYSASASEIVAGALQDHKRAIIIGDKTTHGKGTVQSMIQMNLPFNILANRTSAKTSTAKVTIQKYYLPSGKSTQINGVKSDISIPSINMFLPIGESDLENALPNDKIPAVNFRKTEEQYSFDEDSIKTLNEKANERRSVSEIFGYLQQNIDFIKSKREQKTFSLDLSKRLNQRNEENIENANFKDKYKTFTNLSYPTREIVLSIVTEQVNQSRIARGIDVKDINKKDDFSKPDDIDIALNETINIVNDYLQLGADINISVKTTDPLEKN